MYTDGLKKETKVTDKDLTVLCAVLLYCQKGALGYTCKDALAEAQDFVAAFDQVNVPHIPSEPTVDSDREHKLGCNEMHKHHAPKCCAPSCWCFTHAVPVVDPSSPIVARCCGKHGKLAQQGLTGKNASCCCKRHSDCNPLPSGDSMLSSDWRDALG